jgi:hypothetical protein
MSMQLRPVNDYTDERRGLLCILVYTGGNSDPLKPNARRWSLSRWSLQGWLEPMATPAEPCTVWVACLAMMRAAMKAVKP